MGRWLSPPEGEAARAPGRAPPQECVATNESSGTATPNTGTPQVSRLLVLSLRPHRWETEA